MARTATSQAPVFASSIRRAIVVYSMGAKPTPASAASARPSMNAVPESSPVSRFLLAMTGLPVKRAARISPRGASSASMDGHGSGLERQAPETELMSRQIRREIHRADDLRVHALGVLRRAHLPNRGPESEANQQREKPDHEPKRPR